MGGEQYFVDIHGDLRYESRDRFQASLSTNIFGDKVYKDNRGNEVKYSKTMWEKVPGKDRPYFEDFLFSELIHKYRDRRNVHDTLGKDIFENVIYKDNRGNKVTYSKEFLGKLRKGRHRGDRNIEEFLLLGLAKDVGKKRNYTEEYTVDIFGNVEYKNSEGRRVSIKKDMFDSFEYKDNQGVSLSIRKDIFDHVQVNDGRGNKVDVGRDIFGDLQVKDNKGNKWSVERDIFGDLKFRHNYKECATLKKNIFDEREYSDNKGNKVKYSKESWIAPRRHWQTIFRLYLAMMSAAHGSRSTISGVSFITFTNTQVPRMHLHFIRQPREAPSLPESAISRDRLKRGKQPI